MRPLVSILIPCYNAAKYVAEAIDSALAQTYSPVEVICVDDGSTDGTADLLRAYGDRIKLELAPHRGACAARNRALALSSGEFIQFLDADDVLLSNKLARQIDPLLHDKADLVISRGWDFGDNLSPRLIRSPRARPEGTDPFLYCLSNGFGTEAPLHRKTMLESIGGFREHLPRAQERDLHLRLAAAGARLHLVDEPLYLYRIHDGPRISGIKQKPGYMLTVFMELADVISGGAPYVATQDRLAGLAGMIFQHSIWAYRNGARGLAAAGFRKAYELGVAFEYRERTWYKSAVRIAGPMIVETALDCVRSARNLIKRSTTSPLCNS